MRTTTFAFLLLATLTVLPGVQAQPPSFDEPYQVRAALGDIPTTPAIETAGVWNIEQRLTVQFDNTSAEAQRTYTFALPAGSTLANATCDCARSRNVPSGTNLGFIIEPQTASGDRTIRVVTRQPAATVFGFALGAPPQAVDSAVIVYVPAGSGITSEIDLAEVGASTSGTSVIHFARFDGPLPADAWFAIHPATTAAGPSDAGDDANPLAWLLPALVGLALGMVAWSMLVSRGIVQKKGRKQLAATAAHVEAAAADPPAVLEGKKRALLAALKEVELARQANEMPLEVYDVVKADLKKQAVTVMRALETSSGESKT
ncbi:MAG: hypothetical protein AABY18_03955 [Candidatus Thermoplasmatota archaeon]